MTLARAVAAANQVKSGARILTIGVGAALGNQASVDRLVAIEVVRDAGLATIDSLNDGDVALVTNFADLARFLRSVVLQLCSPSLTIRKLAQTADDNTYQPAPGWSMTVTPSALPPGTGFTWILPDPAPATSKTVVTDAGGFAAFQWEPIPAESNSQAIVQETLQPGFVAGRPDGDDFRCEFRNEAGNVRTVTGELGPTLTFTLNPIGQEIGTCTVYNSFPYAPAINITKLNNPTAVRGDISPPATVTSTYAVTNGGNTPLGNIRVTDDKCAPVTGVISGGTNVGDTDGDARLDVTETWQFQCTRPTVVSRGATRAAAQNVVNTATVTGTDPRGQTVTATDTDDVDVYFPAIELTKLVDDPVTPDPPAESVTVVQGTAVNYTYAVTNAGGTDLAPVNLVDNTPPCTSPVRGPDTPPGNNDAILDVGETWNFSCNGVTPPGDVVNTATVVGTPLNPDTGAPFTGNNPAVQATDFAEVDVINPNLELTKEVTPTVVLIGPDGAPEPVTYTFEANNTGTPELNRPGATTPGPAKEPGWIVDARRTTPATYVSGDTDNDHLLDPSETWVFTCPGSVTETTLNIASITAQPSNSTGAPLPGVSPVTDLAAAFVDVLRPGIAVDKTALVGVVLDGGADPVQGPDVPTPRPAEYLYEVSNTGNVELVLDPNPPADDICVDPGLVFDGGDTDLDTRLDVDEVFVYTCATPLDRDQNNVGPPPGDLSGVVRNTVEVTGIPFFQGVPVPTKSVEATDAATVQVIEPGLTITKTASAAVVLPGTAVTYTYAVTNTGDVGLTVIGPEDDQCAPLEFTGGDRPPFNGILEGANAGGAETFTYECTRILEMPADPDTTHVNFVAVGGVDPLGNLYVAEADAEVRVFDPAISLTKTVNDELVLSGTTVTYEFTVTNTGASPIPEDDILADIQLVDVSSPPVPTCLRPTLISGDTDGDGLLPREPAETWIYQCTAGITAPTTDVAVVRGTGGTLFETPLPIDVFDADAAFVQPFTPAIEVTKTAAPTQLLGSGPVTYTYTVRNTGDVPLADVAARITDDKCSPLTPVSGDEDGDGLLDTPNSIFEDALDEVWTFTCTATVSVTTTNTVVVTGTPTDPGGTPLCTAPADGPVGLLQVASPCDVTDNATAVVTVVAPATVVIVKRTPEPTTARFALSFNIPPAAMPPGACDPSYPTTCIPPPPPDLNCTDITARAFTVLPPDPHDFDGDSDGVGCEDDAPVTLGRDESFTLRNVMPGTYTVTEPAAGPWRLVSLECTDPTGDSVVTIADRQASIVVAPGETVTCTFTNAPTGRLPATGNRQLGASLAASLVLVGLGALLGSVDWRRRRAMRR